MFRPLGLSMPVVQKCISSGTHRFSGSVLAWVVGLEVQYFLFLISVRRAEVDTSIDRNELSLLFYEAYADWTCSQQKKNHSYCLIARLKKTSPSGGSLSLRRSMRMVGRW